MKAELLVVNTFISGYIVIKKAKEWLSLESEVRVRGKYHYFWETQTQLNVLSHFSTVLLRIQQNPNC